MKLAVVTKHIARFEAIRHCFTDDDGFYYRFDDDVQLVRSLQRDEYHAVLYDAATGIDRHRPLFTWRLSHMQRRMPLLVFGTFANRDEMLDIFEAVADDLVSYPFDANELYVRIQRALRRFSPCSQQLHQIVCGPYMLDRRTNTVLFGRTRMQLTSREFMIAWLLFSKAGEYVSRRQIAGVVWGCSEDIVERTLGQHIYKLRKKLDLDVNNSVRLSTAYGRGYKIDTVATQKSVATKAINTMPALSMMA